MELTIYVKSTTFCKLVPPLISTYQPTIICGCGYISLSWGLFYSEKFPIHLFYYTLYTVCLTKLNYGNTLVIDPLGLDLVVRHWILSVVSA